MTTCRLLVLALLMPLGAAAQPDVWMKVEAGDVLYLDPEILAWTPAEARQRMPAHAFLLTKADARATLFRATESYEVPAGAYFFVDDVFPRSRVDLVDALARIEASQLPVRTPSREPDAERPLGLTYGARPGSAASADDSVPHHAERRRAVAYFHEQGRYDAALLSLKRSMNKFPDLYADEDNVRLLMDLYAHFRLYGFLLDECDRLMEAPRTEPVTQLARDWHAVAREALALRGR